jgi:hypothetical protein
MIRYAKLTRRQRDLYQGGFKQRIGNYGGITMPPDFKVQKFVVLMAT